MLKRVFSYMKEYKKYAWSGLLCIGVEVVLEITVPLLMADLIDYGVTNADGTYIIKKGLQMALCAVLALILGVGSAKFSALAGQGLGANIRKAEYEKLQSYSFSNIDHFSVSSLVTRLTSDVTNIQNAVSTGMRPFGRSPVMLIFATSFAFRINSTLALVFLVALPTLAVLLILIIINVGPLYGRMQSAIDQVNRCIQENLTAIRVVKSYVRGDYEVEKFGVVNENLKSESEKAFGTAVLNMPAMQFVMYGTILGILLIGGRLINEGQMMIGQLTSFLSYVLLILNSLMMMSNVFLLMTRSLASAERIMEVIDEKIDITDEGAVSICGVDQKSMDEAANMVKIIATDFEAGQIFTGKVVSIKEFGAFVEFAPGKEGMVHISKICKERINRVEDVLTLGDKVKVVCLGKDKMGRISFSMKDVPEEA